MSDAAGTTTSVDRDERLARLLGELTEQCRQGREPDLDGVGRKHPDLADELRELWATVRFAEAFAPPSGGGSRASSPKTAADHVATTPPPRTFGDYEMLDEIGRGGMGVVFRARQRSLDRIVALKMILRGSWASADDLTRFRREAEAAARLHHANIVGVYEVGECDGQPYFSMEFIEGQTLADRINDGPLPPRDAARYLLGICRAVQHAHENGLLHRDLKPSNVILDMEDQPHVTDFGLAKRVATAGEDHSAHGSLTRTGAIIGTPSYMAPEQAAGSRGQVSAASDIYSLGAILYEMLTGRPPFRAATPVDTLMQVLDQEPVAPRLFNPKVDRELELVSLKCLQKPADLRYATAAELANDLEAYLKGELASIWPGGIGSVLNRMFRETHHAPVLENWGVLWMWHSLKILLLCVLTALMHWAGIDSHFPYLVLWGVGLLAWGCIFWHLRKRGGPVTFVERQIAHIWAAGIVGSISIFVAEWFHGMPVLSMAPGLAVLAALTFLIKAGILTGSFYFAFAAMFATGCAMALMPDSPALQVLLFGIMSAVCFFVPGFKYYRQRLRSEHQRQGV